MHVDLLLVPQLEWSLIGLRPTEHDRQLHYGYDYEPLQHCEQSGNVARKDRIQHCGMCDTIRFYILDDVEGYAAHEIHGQIDICRHIYTHQPLQMVDTTPSCI